MSSSALKLSPDAPAASTKVSLKDRIARLFDGGAFTELLADFENGENVVVGFGNVNGRKTYLISDNPLPDLPKDISCLAMKKCAMIKIIREEPHPLVTFLDTNMVITGASSGFHVPLGMTRVMLGREGAAGYLAAFARLSGLVPRVSVLAGDIAAGWTFAGAQSDALILTRGRHMCLARKDSVQKVTGKTVNMADLAGAEMHCSVSGVGDGIAPDDYAALDWVKQWLSYVPNDFSQLTPASVRIAEPPPLAPESDGKLAFETKRPFDMKNLINGLVDNGSFLEIKELYAPEMVTGFARLKGKAIGIVANNSSQRFGCIYPESCRKAAKFSSVCNSFGIPLVFLADTPGLMVDPELEKAGIIKYAGLLLTVIADATVPKINVIVRKSFGGGVLCMAGPGYADYVMALPYAAVGPWGLSTAREPQTEREKQGLQEVIDMTDPQKVLQKGYFDRVVTWDELRGALDEAVLKFKITVRKEPKPTVAI
jgi:acetyl-CoA carboxylase carboxyltransferase component